MSAERSAARCGEEGRFRRTRAMLGAFAAVLVLGACGRASGQGLVPPPASGRDLPDVGERHALLVGNSAYDGVAWRSLPGVPYDIEAVAQALAGHGYEVVTLMDVPASRMRYEFERFIKEKAQRKNGTVILYYAGHGVSVRNIAGVEQGYLVPVDAPNPRQDSTAFLDALLPIYEFGIFSMRMQARHALFLFDACFAGTIFKDLGLERDDTLPPAVAELLVRPARSVITSGSAGQKVPDDSYFRRFLVEALTGEAGRFGDGFLTGEELGAYLRARVLNEGGGGQRPQFGRLDLAGLADGDFVFGLSAVVGPAVAARRYREWVEETRAGMPQLRKEQPTPKVRLLFMQTAFGTAEAYDEDPDLLAEDKIGIWKVFLDSFAEDLVDLAEDDELRLRAVARQNGWRKDRRRVAAGPG